MPAQAGSHHRSERLDRLPRGSCRVLHEGRQHQRARARSALPPRPLAAQALPRPHAAAPLRPPPGLWCRGRQPRAQGPLCQTRTRWQAQGCCRASACCCRSLHHHRHLRNRHPCAVLPFHQHRASHPAPSHRPPPRRQAALVSRKWALSLTSERARERKKAGRLQEQEQWRHPLRPTSSCRQAMAAHQPPLLRLSRACRRPAARYPVEGRPRERERPAEPPLANARLSPLVELLRGGYLLPRDCSPSCPHLQQQTPPPGKIGRSPQRQGSMPFRLAHLMHPHCAVSQVVPSGT